MSLARALHLSKTRSPKEERGDFYLYYMRARDFGDFVRQTTTFHIFYASDIGIAQKTLRTLFLAATIRTMKLCY